MNAQESILRVFTTHADAERAIRSRSASGVDMTRLSIVGKGYHSEEHVLGFYAMRDKIKTWGGIGAFWGGIWGLMVAPAAFVLPGLGLKSERYVLIMHGDATELKSAASILDQARAVTQAHPLPVVGARSSGGHSGLSGG